MFDLPRSFSLYYFPKAREKHVELVASEGVYHGITTSYTLRTKQVCSYSDEFIMLL